MIKVVFLDRDGVINVKLENDYVKKPEEFIFLEGVSEALHILKAAGYRLFIVTNQRGIARGLMSYDDVAGVHAFMQEKLVGADADVDGIFFCPHEAGTCRCRKPEIGLFLQAEDALARKAVSPAADTNTIVDKTHSYMIGDSASDIEAGRRYGVRTVFVGDPEAGSACGADYSFDNLLSAAEYICSN